MMYTGEVKVLPWLFKHLPPMLLIGTYLVLPADQCSESSALSDMDRATGASALVCIAT